MVPKERKLEAALAFVIILLLFFLLTGHRALVIGAAAGGFLLGAVPPLLNGFYFLWSRLLGAVHFVTGKVLLSLIFGLVVVPLSFIVRRSRKRTLTLDNRGKSSLFVVRNHRFVKEDLEEMW